MSAASLAKRAAELEQIIRNELRYKLDMEIAFLRSGIRHLCLDEALLLQKRNQLCLIATLPPEILSEIFITAAAQEHQRNSRSKEATTVVPLILSRICSDWRQIALGLSEIWASFHYRVATRDVIKQGELLSQWLRRAGSRLLTIRLSFRDEQAWVYSCSTVIIDALVPYSRQWRNLDLVVTNTWLERLYHLHESMDNLQSLSIRPVAWLRQTEMFATAPKLRKVEFMIRHLSAFTLPWVQLTSATIHFPSVYDAHTTLYRCPNLTSYHLKSVDSIHALTFFVPLSHGKLEHLEIAVDTDRDIPFVTSFVNALEFPRLRRLDLSLPAQYEDPFPLVETLIKRSHCYLRSVNIGGPSLSEDAMTDFLLRNSKCVRRVTNNVPQDDEN